MSKHMTVLLIALLCFGALGGAVLAASDYDVDRFVIGGGGEPSSSESYAREGIVVGQAVAESSDSESYEVDTGFWTGVARNVFLPLVLRAYGQ